jgi:hypothetical protein
LFYNQLLVSHPYTHACASAERYGGQADDYLPIHNWIDASKAHYAEFRHRFLRHHEYGVREMAEQFGKFTNSDGARVDSLDVGMDHLMDDHGQHPDRHMWFEGYNLQPWMSRNNDTSIDDITEKVANAARCSFNLAAVVTTWFHVPSSATPELRVPYRAFTHHSYGLFELERIYGVYRKDPQTSKFVPLRPIGEHYLRAVLGIIPTLRDWARYIQPIRWMNNVTLKSQK